MPTGSSRTRTHFSIPVVLGGMTPADLFARLVGLVVAVAGGVLAWGGLLVPLASLDGARGVDLLARGAVANVAAAAALAGVGFVIAGVAVLVDRGRSVAVSVGGAVLVATVVLLALGIDSGFGASAPVGGGGTAGVIGVDGAGVFAALGVGALALAVVLAGASIGGRGA